MPNKIKVKGKKLAIAPSGAKTASKGLSVGKNMGKLAYTPKKKK